MMPPPSLRKREREVEGKRMRISATSKERRRGEWKSGPQFSLMDSEKGREL